LTKATARFGVASYKVNRSDCGGFATVAFALPQCLAMLVRPNTFHNSQHTKPLSFQVIGVGYLLQTTARLLVPVAQCTCGGEGRSATSAFALPKAMLSPVGASKRYHSELIELHTFQVVLHKDTPLIVQFGFTIDVIFKRDTLNQGLLTNAEQVICIGTRTNQLPQGMFSNAKYSTGLLDSQHNLAVGSNHRDCHRHTIVFHKKGSFR